MPRSPIRPEFSPSGSYNAIKSIENSKTQRNLTKSVDLIRNNHTIDHIATGDNNSGFQYRQLGNTTVANRAAKLNDIEMMSQFSADEWTEIEKFNALAEAHDERMKVVNNHKSQKMLQENLRKQIIEQRRFKQQELQQEKLIEQKSMQLAHQEQLKAERKEMELKRKVNDRKEMVDKQLKAHQMHKRLHDQEKQRYEKKLVSELKQKLALDKQVDINKKIEQRMNYSKIREENEQLKTIMVESKQLELERDKKYIEDYNKMIEMQEQKRIQEREERNQRVKARVETMGNEILKNRGEKDKQLDMVLLKGIKESEAKAVLNENKKMFAKKVYQKDLRGFLAGQVEEKRRFKDFEKQKNKWFIDQEYVQAIKEKEEEKHKIEERKMKEFENKKFVADQIGMLLFNFTQF